MVRITSLGRRCVMRSSLTVELRLGTGVTRPDSPDLLADDFFGCISNRGHALSGPSKELDGDPGVAIRAGHSKTAATPRNLMDKEKSTC
jgi:hypothetical protein